MPLPSTLRRGVTSTKATSMTLLSLPAFRRVRITPLLPTRHCSDCAQNFSMSWMDRERFLEGFTYEVEKDFDVNSTPSSWADAELSLAHRYWGDEDHRIELPHPDDHTCRLSTSALTPDKKFIAASNGFVVNLHDVATKECHMVFRGLTMAVFDQTRSSILIIAIHITRYAQ